MYSLFTEALIAYNAAASIHGPKLNINDNLNTTLMSRQIEAWHAWAWSFNGQGSEEQHKDGLPLQKYDSHSY